MDWKLFAGVVATAFIAELGDKSQVLTLLYASGKNASPIMIFLGVSFALVAATGIGVLAGSALAAFLSEKLMAWLAGSGFIVIGLLTLLKAQTL